MATGCLVVLYGGGILTHLHMAILIKKLAHVREWSIMH
jgi:hypothetical protein